MAFEISAGTKKYFRPKQPLHAWIWKNPDNDDVATMSTAGYANGSEPPTEIEGRMTAVGDTIDVLQDDHAFHPWIITDLTPGNVTWTPV